MKRPFLGWSAHAGRSRSPEQPAFLGARGRVVARLHQRGRSRGAGTGRRGCAGAADAQRALGPEPGRGSALPPLGALLRLAGGRLLGRLRRSRSSAAATCGSLTTAISGSRRRSTSAPERPGATRCDRRSTNTRSTGPALPIVPLVPPITESTEFDDLRVAWTGTPSLRPAARRTTSAWASKASPRRAATESSPAAAVLRRPARRRLPDRAGACRRVREWRWSRGGFVAELGLREPTSSKGEGEEVSPRLGLRYTPEGGAWSVRASAGEAFKLPSLYALATPRAIGGNPNLQAETSAGADLGVEFRAAGGSARGGLTLFSNRFENLIDFDFDTFQIVNRSKVDARGVEAFLVWRPSSRVGARCGRDLRRTPRTCATGRPLRRRPDLYGGVGLRDRPESSRSGSASRPGTPAPISTSRSRRRSGPRSTGRTLVGAVAGLAGRGTLADQPARGQRASTSRTRRRLAFPGPNVRSVIGVRDGRYETQVSWRMNG